MNWATFFFFSKFSKHHLTSLNLSLLFFFFYFYNFFGLYLQVSSWTRTLMTIQNQTSPNMDSLLVMTTKKKRSRGTGNGNLLCGSWWKNHDPQRKPKYDLFICIDFFSLISKYVLLFGFIFEMLITLTDFAEVWEKFHANWSSVITDIY